MAIRSKVWSYVAALLFSNFAVWLFLFSGAFKLLGEPFSRSPVVAIGAVCAATAVIFFGLGKPAFASRRALIVSSILAGVAMPLLAIIVPVLFCVLMKCRGFDMP